MKCVDVNIDGMDVSINGADVNMDSVGLDCVEVKGVCVAWLDTVTGYSLLYVNMDQCVT